MIYMHNFTMKRNAAQWKVKGYITRFTPVRSDRKKGEEGWAPNYKPALIK